MKYRKMQQSKFGLPVTATGSTQKKIYRYKDYNNISITTITTSIVKSTTIVTTTLVLQPLLPVLSRTLPLL